MPTRTAPGTARTPASKTGSAARRNGPSRYPSREFAINTARLTAVLTAADLVAFAQTIVLHDQPDFAHSAPKALRYRLLHVAARLTLGQR